MPGMEQRMQARSWILAGVQRPVTSNAAAAVVRPDGHHAGGRRPAGSGVGRVACGTRWSSRTWSTRPYCRRVTRCRVPDSYQKRGTPPGLSRAVSGLLYGLTFNPVLIIVFGLDPRIPGRAGTRSVKPVIAACRPVHPGAEPDAFAYPARTKATAARARTVRCSPGSDLCEVELPNTLRCTGHAHATTPRYRPHAGNGPLRPSVAPGEDYAALQTSQTPAACRC